MLDPIRHNLVLRRMYWEEERLQQEERRWERETPVEDQGTYSPMYTRLQEAVDHFQINGFCDLIIIWRNIPVSIPASEQCILMLIQCERSSPSFFLSQLKTTQKGQCSPSSHQILVKQHQLQRFALRFTLTLPLPTWNGIHLFLLPGFQMNLVWTANLSVLQFTSCTHQLLNLF